VLQPIFEHPKKAVKLKQQQKHGSCQADVESRHSSGRFGLVHGKQPLVQLSGTISQPFQGIMGT
jgi:hypothetical protein